MIFHQTYPHSHPPCRSSRLEVYIVRSGRRTGRPDRAGLKRTKEATKFNHTCISQCRICTTPTITTSWGCKCLASANFLSLNHTVQLGRSEGHGKCAVAWQAISYMLHSHGDHAWTAHKWCLVDVGYACQPDNEETFIIIWLTLTDWSSKDKTLTHGRQCDIL